MLIDYMANQRTKFEVSRFSHSRDILVGLRMEMGHVTITSPYLWVVFHLFGKT